MGHKINPIALRLHTNRTLDSSWYSDYKYADFTAYETSMRNYIKALYSSARLLPGRILSHRNSLGVHNVYILSSVPLVLSSTKDKMNGNVQMRKNKIRDQKISTEFVFKNKLTNLISLNKKQTKLFLNKERIELENKINSFSILNILDKSESISACNLKEIVSLNSSNISLSKELLLNSKKDNINDIEKTRRQMFVTTFFYLFQYEYLLKKKYFLFQNTYLNSIKNIEFKEISSFIENRSSISSEEKIKNKNSIGQDFYSKIGFINGKVFPFFYSKVESTRLVLECKPEHSLFVKKVYPIENHLEKFFNQKSGLKTTIQGLQTKNIFQNATIFAYMIARGLEQKKSLRYLWQNILEELESKKKTSSVNSQFGTDLPSFINADHTNIHNQNRLYKKVDSYETSIKGIRILCAGRLNGVEMARIECKKWGQTPLSSFKEKIDYSTDTAHTVYGCIGVKVWICYK